MLKYSAVPFMVSEPFCKVPPGPNHIMTTVTGMFTDGCNWTSHVRLTLAPMRTGSVGVDVSTVLGLGTKHIYNYYYIYMHICYIHVVGTHLSHFEWMMYLQWSVQVMTPHKSTVLHQMCGEGRMTIEVCSSSLD